MKWIRSFRASTSRSYVVPLIVTVIVRDSRRAVLPRASAPLRGLVDGANGEHLGEVRAVLARGVDVGRRLEVRGARRPRARRRRRPSRARARPAPRRRSRARSVTLPFTDAAALTMHVPSTPSVTAAKPSPRPAGTRDLASAARRCRPPSCRRRGRSPSAETVRSPLAPAIVICAPSAASSGGRWFVGSFVQTLPPIVPRLRTCTSAICAQTSPRIGRARASLESTISV